MPYLKENSIEMLFSFGLQFTLITSYVLSQSYLVNLGKTLLLSTFSTSTFRCIVPKVKVCAHTYSSSIQGCFTMKVMTFFSCC